MNEAGSHALRVLMVSTSYPQSLRDWRGLFIRHLADGLARREDLRLRLWAPFGEKHPDAEFDLPGRERAWLERLMRAGGIAHLVRSADCTVEATTSMSFTSTGSRMLCPCRMIGAHFW
jgi:hypothetical protein